MARMLSQLPLPLLPPGAAEIAPGVGFLAGEEGGLVTVHGLATFAWDAGDEAARAWRRCRPGPAACRVAGPGGGGVRGGSGHDLAVGPGAGRGRGGRLVPARRGPKGASKLTPQLAARIAELDAAGQTLRQIAAATGVSTFSVRNALGRVASAGQPAAAGTAADDDAGAPGIPVLPDPVPRDAERVLARWGLLGEGAGPVFTPWAPGIRWPGCCWRCPPWRTPACCRWPGRSTGSSRTGSTG